jgi:hypothetical protein
VRKDKKPISDTHPELAKEADGWDPKTVVAGTRQMLSWKCKLGHPYLARGYSRITGSGCPYCANRKVLIGFNDLLTTNLDLALEADGWDPKTVISGTTRKLSWKCQRGHIWIASGSKRKNGRGCPVCSSKKVLSGFNDLFSLMPDIAKEAHGWDPETVSVSSGKKLEWKCINNHIWKARVYSRIGGSGCPICSNQKISIGINDLLTTHPELAKEADGWDPTKVVAGSDKKKDWKCDFGHEWSATLGSRKNGTGCPSCSVTGFDPHQSGFLYFLIHPKWEIFQIGISNFPEDRLKVHRRNGFDSLELRGPMEGKTAQELETAILRYLKSQKADLSPEHIAGKFDGYSESWTIDSYKVNNLKELIDKANEAGY